MKPICILKLLHFCWNYILYQIPPLVRAYIKKLLLPNTTRTNNKVICIHKMIHQHATHHTASVATIKSPDSSSTYKLNETEDKITPCLTPMDTLKGAYAMISSFQ